MVSESHQRISCLLAKDLMTKQLFYREFYLPLWFQLNFGKPWEIMRNLHQSDRKKPIGSAYLFRSITTKFFSVREEKQNRWANLVVWVFLKKVLFIYLTASHMYILWTYSPSRSLQSPSYSLCNLLSNISHSCFHLFLLLFLLSCDPMDLIMVDYMLNDVELSIGSLATY